MPMPKLETSQENYMSVSLKYGHGSPQQNTSILNSVYEKDYIPWSSGIYPKNVSLV